MIKTRLVKLLSNSKKYIYLNIIIQWVSLVAQMLAIFTLTSFVADVFSESVPSALHNVAIEWVIVDVAGIHVNYTMLLLVLVTLLLLVIIRMISDKLLARINYLSSANVKKVLRDKIYDKLLRLGPSYKESVSTAEVVQLSTEGVEQLETYFGKYLPQLFYSLLAPITLFIVLVNINVKASVVLLICVPLIPISIVVVQKIAKKLLSKYWGIYTELGDSFLDNLNGLTTLKIYQADKAKAELMDEESNRFRKITMKVLTMQLNSTSVMDIVAYGGAAVGMIVVISEYFKGNVGLAGALSIILLSSEFFIPLRLLGSYFHIAMNGMAASDKIFRLLDLEEPAKGSKDLVDSKEATINFMKGEKADSISILMENVSFGYDSERQILKGIDLTLPANSFISLVGESGSGKSTIAAILTGKLRDFKGTIKVNGINIEEIRHESLLSNITLVKNNSYLFKGTVRQNLLQANADASDEDMWEVLKSVDLDEVFKDREGLDTLINERATNLSGGQAQRLCVARALLCDTPMYIFDEATSNIDAGSEEIIMNLIHKLAKVKTVLLISHRLKNVVNSDCIYMLKDGQIVEAGTHNELILNIDNKAGKTKGYGEYAKLYNAQDALENFHTKNASDINVIDTRSGVCLYNSEEDIEQKRQQELEELRQQKILEEVRDKEQRQEAFLKVRNSLYEIKGYKKLNHYETVEQNNNSGFGFFDNKESQESEEIKNDTVKMPVNESKEINGLVTLFRLLGLVKPLAPIMLGAIILGTIGYMCAISISIFATGIITQYFGSHFEANGVVGDLVCGLSDSQRNTACIILFVIAILRGFLHYAEQYCNHFIAFKLLAIIRHKVFAALSKLAPAKLDSKDRGNLISVITSDIELLEVFYAHTISPIAIAVLVSVIMLVFFGHISSIAAVIAALAYITVGIIIPLVTSKLNKKLGQDYRKNFGDLNSYCLDSYRGLDETIQYNAGLTRRLNMAKMSNRLSKIQLRLSRIEGSSKMWTNLCIYLASYIMFVTMLFLADNNAITYTQCIISTVAMLSSFGPVTALSSLSNTFTNTLASAKRVIAIIDEKPETEEITDSKDIIKTNTGLKIVADKVSFAYNEKEILRDYNAFFEKGKITGIYGKSGCGKSTLLKLIMRYYDVSNGSIKIEDSDVKDINTVSLRDNLAFVSQETELFNDTIAANIAIAKADATREEIIEAAKKASLHDFVMSLPKAYDTVIGELGDALSGGEKQRIGVARAFLHDGNVILMDEPTSNLDSLNEGIILKSLADSCKNKTIIIVSHRDSTMNIVDNKILV
nr:ATP-binding cassette domain-containing protein [Lachnospira multipara]